MEMLLYEVNCVAHHTVIIVEPIETAEQLIYGTKNGTEYGSETKEQVSNALAANFTVCVTICQSILGYSFPQLPQSELN